MFRPIIVTTLLVILLGGLVEESSLAQTAQDSYASAVDLWGSSFGISITDGARREILSGFRESRGVLADSREDRRWKNSDRTLGQSLVIYYLDDLRDAKTADFLLGSAATAIGIGDVDHYPVKEFISKVQPVLKARNGELHTTSDPAHARILLDGKKVGFTEKITVEVAGRYLITVSGRGVNCSDYVTIPDGGSVTFHCP
jgi:hypothetical protein